MLPVHSMLSEYTSKLIDICLDSSGSDFFSLCRFGFQPTWRHKINELKVSCNFPSLFPYGKGDLISSRIRTVHPSSTYYFWTEGAVMFCCLSAKRCLFCIFMCISLCSKPSLCCLCKMMIVLHFILLKQNFVLMSLQNCVC